MITAGHCCIHYAYGRIDTTQTRGFERPGERRAWQSRAVRQLAASLLAELTATREQDWSIGAPAARAPRVVHCPAGGGGFRISLTHDADLVGCAVAHERAVGIDIQRLRTGDCRALAEFCGWYQMLPALADPLDGVTFSRLWALWEACIKRDGGIAVERLNVEFPRAIAAAGQAHEPTARVESIGAAWLAVVA